MQVVQFDWVRPFPRQFIELVDSLFRQLVPSVPDGVEFLSEFLENRLSLAACSRNNVLNEIRLQQSQLFRLGFIGAY